MKRILIFVETKEGEPKKVSLELLSEARKVAKARGLALEAVVMGQATDALKIKVLPYVSRLVSLTDPVLEQYTAEGYALAFAVYARELAPALILGGATPLGRDFLPRVAVLLNTGIASDVTEARWESMTFVRPMYGGKVLSEVAFTAEPVIVTVRPNTFSVEAPEEQKGEYAEQQAGIAPEQIKTRVVKREEVKKGKVDLIEADVIVSGGRGLKAAENFALLEALADVIGATVGASRSVVDAKWRDQEDQVGKSGKTVSPRFYMAVGISGAIHHIMGMDTSKLVLAINKDPNAIIFNYADYGIVGDFAEVIPAMTEEFKKRLGK